LQTVIGLTLNIPEWLQWLLLIVMEQFHEWFIRAEAAFYSLKPKVGKEYNRGGMA
jgi:hypothetical protein